MRAILAAALLAGCAAWAEEPAERVLLAFDGSDPAGSWVTSGKSEHAVADAPAPSGAEGSGPAGKALSLKMAPGGAVASQGFDLPADWRAFQALSLWVFRDPAEALRRPGGRLEVQVLEEGGGARFRRTVELQHTGWCRLWLPLRWFRWGDGRVPRWDRVARLLFACPDGGELSLDSVALVPGAGAGASDLSAEDLRALAFPGAADGSVRTVASPDVLLLTDAPELDPDKLAAHLAGVKRAVYETFPFLEPPCVTPVVIVFRTNDTYQDFTPRLARQLNALAAEPQANGFTILGIATSSWHAELRQDRPVYAHEYVHALLALSALLPNRGDWMQEGLATLFQLRFHPQEGLAELVAKGVANLKAHQPLPKLCGGDRLPLGLYWQAMTVWETLRGSERWAPRLGGLFQAVRDSGSSDLGRHLGVLGATWEELDAAWQAHCAAKYGAGK